MRKIFSTILISSLIFGMIGSTFSASIERDFNVKFSSAGDDTYTTNLTNISRSNTDLTFQFVEVSSGGPEEYSLNLPTGFTYQSSNTTGNTCANFTVIDAVNTNFHFSFNGAPNCVAKTEFTYRVTSTTPLGSNPLYLLEKSGTAWSIAADLSLSVTATNSITSAVVQDLDADGYVDAYLLSFTTTIGVNAATLSGLTVGGVTPGVATASGSNWILPFTDGVLATGQLPQIGGVFDTVTIGNTTIAESFPTFNCTASTRVSSGHSYSIPFFNNATTTSVVSSAVAITGGSITYTQVFACTTAAVTASGSEVAGTPTCNAGYQVSGSSCIVIPSVPSSGGGGGGGISADYCPTGDLSGNLYDGKCTAPVTATGTTSTGTLTVPVAEWIPTPSSGADNISGGTLDLRYFTDLTAAYTYLRTKITTPAVIKLADSYKNKLTIPDVAYYLSIDQNLYPEYNRVINAYVLLFLRVQDAVNGNRSETVKSEGRQSAAIVMSGVTLAKNILDRYIVRVILPAQNITVYRIKNPALTKALAVLETKVLTKFNLLLSSGTITRTEYDTAVQAYNNFVLHLSLYRDYGKTKLSKDRALAAIKIFTTVYAKRVINTGDITLSSELAQKQQAYTEANRKLVGDVYTFVKDLGIGDKNQDVTNLQTILKSYGYFGTLSPTGYFGTLTAGYLTKFSADVLGINNPNGVFNSTIRNAILKIDLK